MNPAPPSTDSSSERTAGQVFRRRAVTAAAVVGTLGAAGVAGAVVDDGSTDAADGTTADTETTGTATETEAGGTGTTSADRHRADDEDGPGRGGQRDTADGEEALTPTVRPYEAHMTDADGDPITVTFAEDLSVVDVLQGR